MVSPNISIKMEEVQDSRRVSISNEPVEISQTVEAPVSAKINSQLSSHIDPENQKDIRKSYQFRALARKTIVYQKRQVFVNVFCIGLCPMLMVLFAFGIGVLVSSLLSSTLEVQQLIYCSKVDNLNPNGFPNTSSKFEKLDKNYFELPVQTGSFRRPVLFGGDQSCVYWFGKDYPYSSPYEKNPNLIIPTANSDSTFRPQPVGGWLGNPSYTDKLIQYQRKPWWIVQNNPDIELGTKNRVNISFAPPFETADNDDQGGFLSRFQSMYFLNSTQENLERVPYFLYFNGTDKQLNALIGRSIQSAIDDLQKLNKGVLSSRSPSRRAILEFYAAIANIVPKVPFGAISFKKFDIANKDFEYVQTVGTDGRLAAAVTFPSPGFRRLVQQANIADAIAQTISPNLKITAGIRAMPQVVDSGLNLPIGSLVGSILYPFGVSFLLCIFVLILVKEKEDRIEAIMKMNGLGSLAYFTTHYIHFYFLHILATLVFIAAGWITGMELFTQTDPWVYIILFFFWGHAQVALSFLISNFFDKNRTALVITFLIVVIGVIVNLATSNLLWNESKAPLWYFIWAPFAFYRALQLVNKASYDTATPPYDLKWMFSPGDEAGTCIYVLIVETFVYLMLAGYLKNVLKSEFGVKKPWYYPFQAVANSIKKLRKIDKGPAEETEPEVKSFEEETFGEDEEVKKERTRIESHSYAQDCPVIMSHMRKDYSSGRSKVRRVACKDVSLAIERDSIFGLLGPNGAGKTTLISILTGLYSPTSGKALISGFDVRTQMDDVYRRIGICPQHDILWDDLTVEEHLLFYARIKGIDSDMEDEVVKKSMEKVDLWKFRNVLSKNLSGGSKRRLSIAMSLVGDPKVVFLDEPTTGLDPDVRRQIWTIINEAKLGKTIILTTHSMEEAEVLSNRIGIMAKGNLRCLGAPLFLKAKYGSGFKLAINCSSDKLDKTANYIEGMLPEGWNQIDKFSTSVSYEFKMTPGIIKSLFDELSQNSDKAEQLGIEDWGLTQTSLDEVFLRIIKESDADAD